MSNYRMLAARVVMMFLIMLAMAACGEEDDQDAASGAATTSDTSPTVVASPTERATPDANATPTKGQTAMDAASPSSTNLPRPVQIAIEQAANEAGVSEDAVELIEYEQVEWRDTSLGCPQPGMMYAQVIVPGYLVRLNVGGETIEYHTDADTTVVQCNGT